MGSNVKGNKENCYSSSTQINRDPQRIVDVNDDFPFIIDLIKVIRLITLA